MRVRPAILGYLRKGGHGKTLKNKETGSGGPRQGGLPGQRRGLAGLAEQVALDVVAAGGAHQRVLLLGLDPLGGGDDVEAAGEARDGADDRGAVAPARQLLHEGAVDLDLVEWEHLQIAERRVAGAEIVEHDRGADTLDRVQRREVA